MRITGDRVLVVDGLTTNVVGELALADEDVQLGEREGVEVGSDQGLGGGGGAHDGGRVSDRRRARRWMATTSRRRRRSCPGHRRAENEAAPEISLRGRRSCRAPHSARPANALGKRNRDSFGYSN